MKKIVLIMLLVGSSISQAQLRTSTVSNMENLRSSRKDMEMRTENTILEKLETARLEDERARRKQFEALNFSVVQGPTQTPDVQYVQ